MTTGDAEAGHRAIALLFPEADRVTLTPMEKEHAFLKFRAESLV